MGEKEQILSLLKTLKGTKIDICREIFDIIKKEKTRSAELLQYVCETYEFVRSVEEREVKKTFTKGEVVDLENQYGGIVNAFLKNLLQKKMSKEKFYVALWEKITLESVFETEKAQCFAFYYILIDGRIPYFDLPSEAISIERDEYRMIVDKIRSQEQKARFIMLSDYKQWTEVSYLLLQVLDEVSDSKEKAVLLSVIFQIRERMITGKIL